MGLAAALSRRPCCEDRRAARPADRRCEADEDIANNACCSWHRRFRRTPMVCQLGSSGAQILYNQHFRAYYCPALERLPILPQALERLPIFAQALESLGEATNF